MLSPSCLFFCESLLLILNASTNLYGAWYLYHGIWAHLNGLLHKSLSLVYVSQHVSLLSLLGNGSVIPEAMNTRNNRKIVYTCVYGAVCVSSYCY
jgi:hypothetical protein